MARRAPPLAWSLLAPGVAALALYLLLTPGVSGDKDGSEFTMVLALNGAAHPTGYPLYTLLGHLFVTALHALGAGWSYAANAWSAVGGALAVAFLHALAARLIPAGARLGRGGRFLVALMPAALFGLNPIWTYETTLAEVYSWHLAWTVGTCLLFARIVRAWVHDPPWPKGRRAAWAALWGFVCGVGGAHHATAIFVAVPLTLALLWVGWRRRRYGAGEMAIVLAAALLPLASYGWIFYRASAPALWQWPTLEPGWRGLWEHMTGAAYGRYLGHFQPSEIQRGFLGLYVYPVLGPALAALLVFAWRESGDAALRALLRALAVSALAGTAYAFSYGVYDPSSYFLAPMALAIAVLAPVAAAARGGIRLLAQRRAARVAAAVGAGAVICALGAAWTRIGADRVAVIEDFDKRVHDMWTEIPFDRAFVFWGEDMFTRLLEYQLLRGEKPHLDVWNPILLTNALPRRAFEAKHGFDAIDWFQHPPPGRAIGLTPEDFDERLAHYVNEHSPLPVILFDPKKESVRVLRKP